MFFSSVKEINRLISRGMPNMYLKVTIEQNWRFLSLKNSSPGQFLVSFNPRSHWILELLITSWNSEVLKQERVWICHHFNFKWNYDVLKSKSPWFFVQQKYNFNKIVMQSKIENPTHAFREADSVLQFIWESQIKGKPVLSWRL